MAGTRIEVRVMVFRFPRVALAIVGLAGVFVAAGCNSATPSITDPNVVIDRSVSAAQAVKSVHVRVEVTGRVNTAALPGLNFGPFSLNLDLAGTAAEGDVDVSNQAADLKLTLPAPLGKGEVVVVGGSVYYKLGLLSGSQFTPGRVGDYIPGGLPSPAVIAGADPSAAIAAQTGELADLGATEKLLATDKVNGSDAYHVSISVPIASVNALLAQNGSAVAGLQLDSASFDYWAYVDGVLPAQFEVKGSSAKLGTFDVTATLTNYNAAVTISAPAASEIGS